MYALNLKGRIILFIISGIRLSSQLRHQLLVYPLAQILLARKYSLKYFGSPSFVLRFSNCFSNAEVLPLNLQWPMLREPETEQ